MPNKPSGNIKWDKPKGKIAWDEEPRAELPSVFSREGAGMALSNVPGSAAQVGKDIYQAVRHPVQTLEGVATIAAGGMQKLAPGEQSSEPAFDAVVDFFKQRYGSLENLNRTAIEDPAGTVMDIIGAVSGGAGVASKVPGLSKLSTVSKAAQAVEPVGAAIRGVSKLGGETSRTAQRLVKSAVKFGDSTTLDRADQLAQAVLDKGLTVKRKTLGKLDRDMRKVRSKVNTIIDAKTAEGIRINSTDIVDAIDDLIANAGKEGLEMSDIKIMSNMRDDFMALHGQILTPRQAQDIKIGLNKGFKSNLSDNYGQVRHKVRDRRRVAVKTQLEGLPGAESLKALNADDGVMIELFDAIEKRIKVLESAPIIQTRGLVAGGLAGGAAGLSTGDIGSALVFAGTAIAAEKIFDSPRIQIKLAKAINAANNKLAKAGRLAPFGQAAFQSGRAANVVEGEHPQP